jgi:hypothetical protein
MLIDKRHKNILFSILLFTSLCAIVFFIHLDSDFAGAIIIFITYFVSIGIGFLFILLRLFKVTISKTNFIYTYFAVINTILGILTFTIMIFNKSLSVMQTLLTLTQLFIGLFIIIDIFRQKKISY